MASLLSPRKSLQARENKDTRSQSPTDPSLLGALQEDVKDLRSLIQCGVCVKLLYEPFTLACGHTFCYSCLTQWFINSRRRKTCPDCRALVTEQPAPAYLVREIVRMFTNREELFEKYETMADHTVSQRAETERIETDKSNTDPREGGLFQGCFNGVTHPGGPIRDADDGVERCPHCTWELEEGECFHCGYRPDPDSDEIDEFDEMDEFGDGFWNDYGDNAYGDFALHQMVNGNGIPIRPPLFGTRRRRLDGSQSLSESETDSEGESSEDEMDDDEMASFISDDEGHADLGTDRSTMLEDRSFMPDEMDNTSELDQSTFHDAENPIEVGDSADEAEMIAGDEESVLGVSQRRGPATTARRRRQIVLSSPASSDSSTTSGTRSPPGSGDDRATATVDDEDASSTEDEGPVSRNRSREDTGSVGTSTTNAITIDDDEEDEGPVRSARRNRIRDRRTRRRVNRRSRRSQELRRAHGNSH